MHTLIPKQIRWVLHGAAVLLFLSVLVLPLKAGADDNGGQVARGFPGQPCFANNTCAAGGDCICVLGLCEVGPSTHPTCGIAAPVRRPMYVPNSNLILLEPLDANCAAGDQTCLNNYNRIAPQPGIGIFFVYFNRMWPWVLGVAAGISILQAMVGGIQIMLSAGSEGKSAGQSRLTWALAGLVLVALAGFILRVLNPIFYR